MPFSGIDEALDMQKIVYNALPDIKNREDIFGEQIVMDAGDNVLRHVDRLLLTASNLSVEDVFSHVAGIGRCCYTCPCGPRFLQYYFKSWNHS